MSPRAKRMWSRVAGAALALLAAAAVLLAALNASALPERAGRAVSRAFTRATGWELTVGRVSFSGPTRLTLHDVAFAPPPGEPAAAWIASGEAERVHVSVNPLHLWFGGEDDAPPGRMTWIAPELRLARGLESLLPAVQHEDRQPPAAGAPDGGTAGGGGRPAVVVEIVDGRLYEPGERAWSVEGELLLGPGAGSGATVERLRLREPREQLEIDVTAQGAGAAGEAPAWRWRAQGPAALLMAPLVSPEWTITGAAAASGEFSAGAGGPVGSFEVRIASGDLRWGDGADEAVSFDELFVSAGLGRVIEIKELRLQRGAGVVAGTGTLGPAAGALARAPLEIEVHARHLRLPDDLPLLDRYGLSGEGAFTGVLSGSIAEPVLSGRLTIAGGTVWHRPVTRGEGVILLAPGRFSFGQTRIEQGTARYRLKGEWRGNVRPATFQMELESAKGRAEELLAAFGAADAGVTGEIDGTITVEGPVDALTVAGTLSGRGLDVRGMPLDTAAGSFVRRPGRTEVRGVTATRGRGTARIDGEVAGDRLDLAVELAEWSLDESPLPLGVAARHKLSGWVSFDGSVGGTWSEPAVAGRLTGAALNLGNWWVTDAAGPVSLTRERITFDAVRATAVGSGEYVVDGSLAGWTGDDPRLDLEVRVSGVSLSTLLREAGLSLPALLLDGQVDGSVRLSGRAALPDAAFDLALGDEFETEPPLRLRFRLEEGRVRLGDLS